MSEKTTNMLSRIKTIVTKPKIKLLSHPLVVFILVAATLTPLALVQTHQAKAQSLPAYNYTKTFNTGASGASANGNAVAVDSNGNVYVAGTFDGTVVFGGSDSYTVNSQSSFLTKYNASGTYQWTRVSTVPAGNIWSDGVAVDSNGNVYITGQFTGTVLFNGTNSQSSSSPDQYLSKYTSSGVYQGTKTFDTSASGSIITPGLSGSQTIAIDSSNNVYIGGSYTGTVVFDGAGGSSSYTAASASDFLTKYNANGSYGWTETQAINSGSVYPGVATNGTNAYITGYNGSTNSVYVNKYSTAGTLLWGKSWSPTAGGFQPNDQSIAVDSNGSVYITGLFGGGTIAFGSNGTYSLTSGGGFLSFIVKISSSGNVDWAEMGPGGTGTIGSSLQATSDINGNLYVSGEYSGSITFDGPSGTNSYTANNSDTFLSEYSSGGTYGWTKTFNTSTSGASAVGYGIATDINGGKVYLTGQSQGTVIFDGTGGSDSQTSTNANSFLTSYQAFIPTSSGPNNGDANGDGIPDYQQPYVSTVTDPISGNYVTLQTNSACTNSGLSATDPATNAVKDSNYSYPAGDVNFTIANCGSPGFTATISLYFYGLNPTGLVLRKYNSNTHTYADVPGVVMSSVIIGGESVTKVTYQVTDGGPLDQDGIANGIIVDPVGLARLASSTTSTPNAPDTGFGGPRGSSSWQYIAAIISLPIAIGVLGYSYYIIRRRIN